MIFVALIILGVLVGVIAAYLFPEGFLGIFANLFLGVLGAFVGAYAVTRLGDPTAANLWEIQSFAALGGAICAVFGANFAYILVSRRGEMLNQTVFRDESQTRSRRWFRRARARSRH